MRNVWMAEGKWQAKGQSGGYTWRGPSDTGSNIYKDMISKTYYSNFPL